MKAWAILEGQIISLCVFGTGAFSTVLASDYNFNAPAFQSMFIYVFLSFYIFACKPWKNGLTLPWWFYLVFACIDVNANYLAVWAYQFTNITSAQLLNCFTIPCAMILSMIFLKAKYNWIHIGAVIISLSGMGLTVWLDYKRNPDNLASPGDALVGDLLVLAGATLYACGNVFQEYMVKRLRSSKMEREVVDEDVKRKRCIDPFLASAEFLGMIGLFGILVSLIHVVSHERHQIAAIYWADGITVGYLTGYVFCLVTMYTLTAHFLTLFDAAVMNLSLLTTHIYAAVFDFFREGSFRLSHALYALSFGLALGGLVLYHVGPPPTQRRGKEVTPSPTTTEGNTDATTSSGPSAVE
ncbi:conserved hypothetical protein [Perkinsus marinus ATCC 50983]|uniref:Uncharacterized protein n=1 Tax=Perkinsus marinus (strain ATCC 50983 / TXsc) TaxID=423536 RepID=C5LMB9_PERM5|nr:conserved hypothetical protein [Perkinsus marinus ATCC 50983]EER02131.1 conserved hypothetical protein [Perkinsus marinus ATCC 50983]|eukprot:XP_002769413.1 conserved hypothetical protein [Perkinsus marinus ATCC 50983]